MKNLILIGDKSSKRTEYFIKASKQYGISIFVVDWKELFSIFAAEDFQGAAVKIDPPSYSAVSLSEMKENLSCYQDALYRLQQYKCCFLNAPLAICETLDKKNAKEKMIEAGVPVTRMFPEKICNVPELLENMEKRGAFSVFIKPRLFSGAAGVIAFRHFQEKNKMAAYTSCFLENGILINTKKIFRMDKPNEIIPLLDAVLALGAVVERWHPKDSFLGKSYDLRVVYQFGKIAYMVARQSSGPITNLHLNNQALEVGRLCLGRKKEREIEEICRQAVSAFPGLHSAGVDLLLERRGRRPLVIEVNGQGDLLYSDIFCENRIYGQQIMKMMSWSQIPRSKPAFGSLRTRE